MRVGGTGRRCGTAIAKWSGMLLPYHIFQEGGHGHLHFYVILLSIIKCYGGRSLEAVEHIAAEDGRQVSSATGIRELRGEQPV
jgi:hypothetical protein